MTGVPAAANPFDPDCISLGLQVTEPSGKTLVVPGFFCREFERKLDRNREVLTALDEGSWRIRWLPREVGRHTLTVTVTLDGKPVGRAESTVEVSTGIRQGLVRVESQRHRYFCLDDGTPLFLNGLCVGWHGRRGTYDYDDWLTAYQQAGINYTRLWMWPQAFGIEWDRDDRLQYRLDNAWRLDRVLAEAERRGVYIMLCLDYHGMFEVKPDYLGKQQLLAAPSVQRRQRRTLPNAERFLHGRTRRRQAVPKATARYMVARWSRLSQSAGLGVLQRDR